MTRRARKAAKAKQVRKATKAKKVRKATKAKKVARPQRPKRSQGQKGQSYTTMFFKSLQFTEFLTIFLPINETKILVITLVFPEAKTHSRARALGLVGLLGLLIQRYVSSYKVAKWQCPKKVILKNYHIVAERQIGST